MNSKSQAALEYLMTYGWALVLIVTIASVLFFVVAPPTSQFSCASSDPTKIVLRSVNPPAGHDTTTGCPGNCYDIWYSTSSNPSRIQLQNATGGNIILTSIDCLTNDGDWGGCLNCDFQFLCDVEDYYVRGWPSMTIKNISATYFGSVFPPTINAGEIFSIDDFGASTYPGAIKLKPPGAIRLGYTDRSGYQKTVTITCNGYPTTPKYP